MTPLLGYFPQVIASLVGKSGIAGTIYGTASALVNSTVRDAEIQRIS